MNDTLKAVGNIGAELAAAKADLQREMERHRKTWRQLESLRDVAREALAVIERLRPANNGMGTIVRLKAALFQQAEPVEPAPAQDERAIGEIVAFGPFLTEVKWSTEDGESPAVGTKLYVRGGRHE